MNIIHLGFEVGTGKPVEIPIRHMAVAGQTQESGKTTTLEALISRSGLRAITFITKRGEKSFAGGHRVPPYFRERADWVFVSSLIDATMGEKNKMIRSWLMRVCRNTKTLAEVRVNVKQNMIKARGFAESIYTEIDGYLDLVVPQLKMLPPVREVKLSDGVNVVDLSAYSTELQGLVIRSMIEHVYLNEEGVITVIPEAWEFLPEGRGSPVKLAAQELIRKGAALKNYVWIDSQDIAGVWKLALRAAPVWLIGVQREANEIKRTLENIPAGIAKPSKADLAKLTIGQFFACWSTHVVKTYVQPEWMDESTARQIAMGEAETPQRPTTAESIEVKHETPEQPQPEESVVMPENTQEESRMDRLERLLGAVAERVAPSAQIASRDLAPRRTTQPASYSNGDGSTATLSDDLYYAIKSRLLDDAPAILKVLATNPEINVEVERVTVDMDGKSPRGRLAQMVARKLLDEPVKPGVIIAEFKKTGGSIHPSRLTEYLGELVALGFVTREDGNTYKAVPNMKINIVNKK